ncbi:Protein kinase, partial [Coemansia sp. RSA 2599]
HALGATSGSPSNAQNSPSRTPSNYFRASLPPLAGTPSSPNQSNSSSIASLAHASLKAQPTSTNPYSHRSESTTGSPIPPNAIASNIAASGIASSPLARTAKDVEMADAQSDTNSDAPLRRPTVMRKRAKLTRTRWHFGIRSRSPPADVMAEVYRALQQLDMKWKHFNPYHLRARYIPPGATVEDAVKIDLQLYKLDSRDNYLVDFKAVIPQPRALEDGIDGGTTTYRAGENTLISPLPPFIQAARRRLSAAASPSQQLRPGSMYTDSNAMLVDGGEPLMSSEPRSLDDQFLDSSYPIQLPAELPASHNSAFAVAAAANDRSDMLPAPESLPAKTVQRRLGGTSPPMVSLSANGALQQGFDSDDSNSNNPMGIPIPGSVSSAKPMAMDIPRSKLSAPTPNANQNMGVGQAVSAALNAANLSHVVGSASSPSANMPFIGGTPRSQGRAPGSYMPGSVVGRVSLARADVSLTADGVGAGSGSNRQSQERVVNIFPFFDVCCKLITELAVPSANTVASGAAGAPAS